MDLSFLLKEALVLETLELLTLWQSPDVGEIADAGFAGSLWLCRSGRIMH